MSLSSSDFDFFIDGSEVFLFSESKTLSPLDSLGNKDDNKEIQGCLTSNLITYITFFNN